MLKNWSTDLLQLKQYTEFLDASVISTFSRNHPLAVEGKKKSKFNITKTQIKYKISDFISKSCVVQYFQMYSIWIIKLKNRWFKLLPTCLSFTEKVFGFFDRKYKGIFLLLLNSFFHIEQNRQQDKRNRVHGNIEYILEIPFCSFRCSEMHSKYTPGGLWSLMSIKTIKIYRLYQ